MTERGVDALDVYMSVPLIAAQMGTKPEELRRYASRKEDPFPIRYFDDKERSGFVVVAEANEWIGRNTVLYADRRRNA